MLRFSQHLNILYLRWKTKPRLFCFYIKDQIYKINNWYLLNCSICLFKRTGIMESVQIRFYNFYLLNYLFWFFLPLFFHTFMYFLTLCVCIRGLITCLSGCGMFTAFKYGSLFWSESSIKGCHASCQEEVSVFVILMTFPVMLTECPTKAT